MVDWIVTFLRVREIGWYNSMVPLGGTICLTHYNVKHFKGSYGRNESQHSLILNCQFCTCVMQISGIPQLQVIHMER